MKIIIIKDEQAIFLKVDSIISFFQLDKENFLYLINFGPQNLQNISNLFVISIDLVDRKLQGDYLID